MPLPLQGIGAERRGFFGYGKGAQAKGGVAVVAFRTGATVTLLVILETRLGYPLGQIVHLAGIVDARIKAAR